MLKDIVLVGGVNAVGFVLMALWMRRLRRHYVDPLNFPNKELATEVEQTRVLSIPCNPEKAILLARSALSTLPKTKVLSTGSRRLDAKTGVTMRTFGERIRISASTVESETSQLIIESKPRFSGTTNDHGKSYENVERIVQQLVEGHSARLVSANHLVMPQPTRGSA